MSKTFQVDKLLGFMQEETGRHWMAKDFQDHPRFIGYEAGPRLCDLCDAGLAVRVGKQGRFMLFALTETGRKFRSVTEARAEQTAPETQTQPSTSDDNWPGELPGDISPDHIGIDPGHDVTPRQRDDFPDEVQEGPAIDAAAALIQAAMMRPVWDLQKVEKYTHRIAYKGGFIDPSAVRPRSTGLMGIA